MQPQHPSVAQTTRCVSGGLHGVQGPRADPHRPSYTSEEGEKILQVHAGGRRQAWVLAGLKQVHETDQKCHPLGNRSLSFIFVG